MTVWFKGGIAIDPAKNVLVKSAQGVMYDVDDHARANPLAMVDMNGLALEFIRSGATGQLEDFGLPDGYTKAVWVSGEYSVLVVSYEAYEQRVIAAEQKAEQAAQAAADAAAGAVTDGKVAALVTTANSATAAAIKDLAGQAYLTLEEGQSVPPDTPPGTLVIYVGPSGPVVYAVDAFERTLAQGWGSADIGGTWTLSQANAFRVEGGAGIWSAPAANTRAAWLADVAHENAEVEALFTTSAIDHAQLIRLHLRRTAADAGYQVAAYIRAATPRAIALKLDANAAEIQGYTSPDVITDYDPGDLIRMRLRVTTVAPGTTSVQARAWKDGTPEPTVWHRSVQDTTASLQANAGFAGVSGYTGGATVTPVEIKIHDFKVIEAV